MPGLLTRRTAITIATACSLILTVSCASSRRMARSSPFSDEPESSIRQTAKSGTDSSLKLARKTDNPPDLNVNQERINFWPLVYSRPELFTILWPMADFDKNGMAVRPFYVRDGDEYSVLFPLAAWNPVNKDGWVLNTYWEKSFNGSFPVYHLGPEFNYVMPVWWTPESIGFPGFCFSRNTGLNYGGPFWYNSASGSGGFFPLCYQKSSDHGWFFPLYFYDQSPNTSLYLPLFGLLGHYRNNYGDKSLMALIYYHSMTKNDNTVNDMLLPLYLYRRNDGWNTVLTLPFMYSSDSKSNDYWVDAAGPLFYRNVKGDESYTGVMCFLGGYSGSAEESTAWAAPFFFKGRDKNSDFMFIFPYYCEGDAAETEYLRSLMPFYYQKKTPDNSDLWLFPYCQSSDKDTVSRAVMPFYYQKNTPDSSYLWAFLYYQSAEKDRVFRSVMPFYYQKNAPDSSDLWIFPYYQGTDKDSVYRSILPFYYQNSDSASSNFWLFPYHQRSGKDSASSSVIPFYRQRRTPEENSFWLFPYYQSSDKDTVSRSVMPFYYQKNAPDASDLWIFPYYQGSDKNATVSSIIPFYYQKDTPAENSLWLFPYYQDSGRDKPFSCAAFPLFYYGGKEKDLLLIPLLSNFSSKRVDILFPLIGYGYQDHSFRFWPAVSVNEGFPSLLVNVGHDGFSFIGPFGFMYSKHKTDQWERYETRSLLLMASSSEKRNAVFPPENIYMHYNSTNMIEQENDFYFLYFRKAERSKIWNPALIEQSDVFELSNNYSQYQSNIEQIRQHNEAEQRHQISSDKIKKMRSKQMEKYKKEMAETRSRLIKAMQKYGMQAKCETEEELKQEIKKFADEYTVIKNEGNTVLFPLFFSGYKETSAKSGSGKSAFSKTGYSLLLPLYYSSLEDDESYTNVLFFMAESTSRPNYSSFRVLRYLYHAEEQNDKYSYDIFPFISTRGSKEFSSYSFGWHLLDIRKDKQNGKRSGHICFIPF